MLMYLLGAASVCDAANDDFYDIARKKIWKWKVAKDAAWEQDKQAVREYLENHRGEKIIKKRIAETLDMPYYRCLDICGALKEEFVPGL